MVIYRESFLWAHLTGANYCVIHGYFTHINIDIPVKAITLSSIHLI